MKMRLSNTFSKNHGQRTPRMVQYRRRGERVGLKIILPALLPPNNSWLKKSTQKTILPVSPHAILLKHQHQAHRQEDFSIH
jgi:hypothetical protein